LHLDLSASTQLPDVLAACDIAFVAAAETAGKQCMEHPAETRLSNVTGTLRVCHHLVEQGVFVVFLSSSGVFDGTAPHRRPDERVSPMTEYARQKAAVEADLLSRGAPVAVVRLTKVLHDADRLVVAWRNTLFEGGCIRPFEDYVCSPVSLQHAVRVVSLVGLRTLRGIHHVSAENDLSFAALAGRLAARWGVHPRSVIPEPAPRKTLEHVPRFATLDASMTAALVGLPVPTAISAIESLSSHLVMKPSHADVS
jgi:dTDP-4-dehydrorhamnose reductase